MQGKEIENKKKRIDHYGNAIVKNGKQKIYFNRKPEFVDIPSLSNNKLKPKRKCPCRCIIF